MDEHHGQRPIISGRLLLQCDLSFMYDYCLIPSSTQIMDTKRKSKVSARKNKKRKQVSAKSGINRINKTPKRGRKVILCVSSLSNIRAHTHACHIVMKVKAKGKRVVHDIIEDVDDSDVDFEIIS